MKRPDQRRGLRTFPPVPLPPNSDSCLGAQWVGQIVRSCSGAPGTAGLEPGLLAASRSHLGLPQTLSGEQGLKDTGGGSLRVLGTFYCISFLRQL